MADEQKPRGWLDADGAFTKEQPREGWNPPHIALFSKVTPGEVPPMLTDAEIEGIGKGSAWYKDVSLDDIFSIAYEVEQLVRLKFGVSS